ncbi:MAG: hypothetical protein AAGK23_02655 [Pseudomonadota bacterium]
MLNWITETRDLLIALFGAGGAGAVLLAWLFSRKKSSSPGISKPAPPAPGISATSSGDGVAVVHGGQGDVRVGVNQMVDELTVCAARDQLALSLLETVRLMKICAAAGLSAEDVDTLLARLEAGATESIALAEAVRAGEEAEAEARRLILRLLSSKPTPKFRAD